VHRLQVSVGLELAYKSIVREAETETIRPEGTRDDPTLSRSSDHVLELKVLRFRENKGQPKSAKKIKAFTLFNYLPVAKSCETLITA
jgi:hypothetical protein